MMSVEGGEDLRTIAIVTTLYVLLDLVKWLVKKLTAREDRSKEIYIKERQILHDIRNALQIFELKTIEMNTRLIDKLSDMADDLREARDHRERD